MRIRVLGCSGSIAAGSRTTSFLVGDDLLVDAGTGVGDLTLDALAAIDHVLISHSHLDHVLSIGLLADSVTRRRRGRPPIRNVSHRWACTSSGASKETWSCTTSPWTATPGKTVRAWTGNPSFRPPRWAFRWPAAVSP